jgi:hypothetical protein
MSKTDNKIPFDWDKFQTGDYDVVTREGKKAVIVSNVEEPDYPINAEIDDISTLSFTINGRYWRNGDDEDDLFLIPKEKGCVDSKLDAIADKIGELSVKFSELEKKVKGVDQWQFNNPNVTSLPPMRNEIYDENGKFFCYEDELADDDDEILDKWLSGQFNGVNGCRMTGFLVEDKLEFAVVKSKLGRRYLVFKKLPF